MKVPDKIYVHVRTEPRPSITFSEAPEKNSTNEEYIRKDVLLEWSEKKINEKKGAMKLGIDDPVLWGQRNAFKQVIDKINSL